MAILDGRLDGRVAIVTGAALGLGRSHALELANQGAAVVINDLGCSTVGEGQSVRPAQTVVNEIAANGGRAVVSYHDISDWQGARYGIRSNAVAPSALTRMFELPEDTSAKEKEGPDPKHVSALNSGAGATIRERKRPGISCAW